MRNITVADHFDCWILPAFCVMGKRAFLFKRNSTDPSQTCFLARVLARCLVLPLVSCSLLVTERFGTQAHREGFHIDSWTFKMAAINQTLIGISPLTPPLSKCQGLELPNGGMSTDADGAYSRGTHTQGDYPMGWPEMLVYRAFQHGQVRWLGEVCTKATG